LKTVYRLKLDRDKYQYFITRQPEEIDDYFRHGCQSVRSSWQQPDVIIYEPFKARGDFFNPTDSTLVLNQKAHDTLVFWLELCGESMSLTYQGETY
jgi:hypothetical protein